MQTAPAPSPAVTSRELVDKLSTVAKGLPAEGYSVDARANALGPGIDASFRWVRDHVRFDAYSGVLRGSEGTLIAGAGNAFDRSLLLAQLLEAKGVRTRFVFGELQQAEAGRLFERMFDVVPAGTADPPPPGGFLSRVVTRAKRDHPVIVGAMPSDLRAAGSVARAQAQRDIRRHGWLQAESDGRWIDLDSAFPDAEPGRAYAEAARTSDEMPAESFQIVTIAVVAERVEDGVLSSSRVLEVTYPAADLLERRVFLVHVPHRGASGMGLGASVAERGDRWSPALMVEEEVEVGEPVHFGDSESSSMFDALGGGGSSAFVAEWIELETKRPDGRRDVVRSPVIDRASAAWRASADHPVEGLRPLMRTKEGPAAAGAVHHVMFSAGPRNLRRYGLDVVDATFPGSPAAIEDASSPMFRRLAAYNAAALVWSDDVLIPSLDDNPELRVYSDSPRIAVVSLSPHPDGGVAETYDLRRDWICVVPKTESADPLVADRKVWFGALAGALEHESVARDAAFAGLDPSSVRSTSALLTTDGAVAIAAGDIARLSELTADADTRARLGATVREGSVAIVPRAALASSPRGWWEVTANGDMRAVLEERNGAWFNSGYGTKPLPSAPKTINIGPELPPEEIEKQIAQILKDEKQGRTTKQRPVRSAARSKGRGNEYQVVLITMANVAIAAGIVVAVVLHRQAMARSAAEFEAWSAAEDAKQQRALRAARGAGS